MSNIYVGPDGVLDEKFKSLQHFCIDFLYKNIQDQDYKPILHNGVLLPSDVCDKFLDYFQFPCNGEINDSLLEIFENTLKTPLKYVHLRNSTISNHGLSKLLNHRLMSLSLWYCRNLTSDASRLLTMFGENLRNLELGLNVKLLKHSEPMENEPVDFELNFPNLRRLVLVGVVMNQEMSLAHLHDLNYIDFTSCTLGKCTLESLTQLPHLQTLILFSVWPISNHLPTICNIKTLHTLDISIVNQVTGQGTYDQPDQKLEMLVYNLPNLTHLDISGTNLAGNGVARKVTTPDEKTMGTNSNYCLLSSDIPGLASRSQHPLQFLGLYQTEHYACKRHDIPAIEIAGEANEKQILTAARYYHDRPIVLTKILNDLYHLFRFESCKEIYTALDVVLNAMDKHLQFKHMQISGSATLFYIVKGREKSKFGTTLKNHIITTLLNGMAVHITDDTMLRNGYLTLTQFSMPADVLFEYERLIKILLHGVSKTEGFVQRIAIYLLNTLACQVDGRQKLVLGELGVISTMLNLIKNRLDRLMFDDVLEVAWSTMWNVTDETAINCKKFLEGQGMQYFLKCLNVSILRRQTIFCKMRFFPRPFMKKKNF
ncbi:ZER1.2 family protein [Megaselia abdita]